MRISMITWEYPPHIVGGMGRHVTDLVSAMAKTAESGADLSVDVITPWHGGGEPVERINEHVTIYRTPIPPVHDDDLYNSVLAGNRSLADQARTLARAHQYDLIHVHDWLAGDVGITLKHEWRAPLVATMHATERGRHQSHLPTAVSRQIDRLEWKVCFEAWKVIVCSRFMAWELYGYFGVPHDKTVVIPNGIDVTPFQRRDDETLRQVRRRYTPNDERLLFFVGRIVYEKGPQVLLRAMPKILERHPNTVLLVAGRNGESMLSVAQEQGVEHAVHFLGFIGDEERNRLYQVVDAAIFPSLYEPFGIVALEAMAAGCNVIVSDVGGLTEVVRHRWNGLAVTPNDADSIARAVNLLFEDAEGAARRRAVAHREVNSLYGWPSITQHTLMLYRQVIEERRRVIWP